MSGAATFWAPQAWVDGGWHSDVLLRVGDDGCWAEVTADTAPPPNAQRLGGPVLPGLVNAHSHAFQRAFAGLAEWRNSAHDDFWSWRERMYQVALRVSPQQVHAIAAQLYAELLQGGYTQVCEFHYLHRAPDGSPYAEPMVMCQALIQAAQDTGIGLTLLPVLYERAGFGQTALRAEQRRFAGTVEEMLTLREGVLAARAPHVNTGMAVHSLRAVAPESIARLAAAVHGHAEPMHVHAAEQIGEVQACVAATGCRPVQWLAQHVALTPRWQLVHATHTTADEVDALARCGAGVVLCPSTEANLGDGVPDLPLLLERKVPIAIGTDSHVARNWPHELRLLEAAQRLVARRRNVAAAPELGQSASAARLFNRALAGGAAAAGLPRWGLVAGARADLLLLDAAAPALLGVPAQQVLDALVFASDGPAFESVWVGGRQVVQGGAHLDQPAQGRAFAAVMAQLWG